MKQPLVPYINQQPGRPGLVPLHTEQPDQPDRDGLATTLDFGVFFLVNHLNGLPQIYEKRYSSVNTMSYIGGGVVTATVRKCLFKNLCLSWIPLNIKSLV